MRQASTQPTGKVTHRVVPIRPRLVDPNRPAHELTAREALRYASPRKGLDDRINEWRERNVAENGPRHAKLYAARWAAKKLGLPYLWSNLWLAIIEPNGRRLDLGLACNRMVTDAGVDFIVDAFQNTVELEILNYHGIGTGATAEAQGDTALVTELTTQYNPDNTRATGTQGENGTNVYQTVGTNAVDSAVGITEHGIFSQAATGGGTLLDRSVFSVVNLSNGESLESTYELTVSAGG